MCSGAGTADIVSHAYGQERSLDGDIEFRVTYRVSDIPWALRQLLTRQPFCADIRQPRI